MVSRACNRIEQAATRIVDGTQRDAHGVSYADVAARTARQPALSQASKVLLDRGKPFFIRTQERIIIGPITDKEDTFPSSAMTKQALRDAIDPMERKINVARVFSGPKSSVIVEGSSLNALIGCQSLATAGLEVKPDAKLNPRVVVHDISIELLEDEIVRCIIEQNPLEADQTM